jgi:hypothetical protein
MTTETYQQPEVATVQGAGPYTIPHEYHAASEISVTVTVATVKTTLTQAAEYTVAPAADATAGAVTLTAATAAQYAGAELRIIRRTVNEQGYAAQGGEREAGLEVQLDRQTRGIQDASRRLNDLEADVGGTLRVPNDENALGVLPAAAARAQTFLGFDADGAPTLYSVDLSVALEQLIADGGSMAGQDADDVAITGGAINGAAIDSTAIGGTTPAAGAFTTVAASGPITSAGTAAALIVQDTDAADGDNKAQIRVDAAVAYVQGTENGKLRFSGLGSTDLIDFSARIGGAWKDMLYDGYASAIDFGGAVTAASFEGDGSALTGITNGFLIVQETQSSGTNGGTFTAGAWRTRALNTTQHNSISLASLNLANSQVTLPAGTYRVKGGSGSFKVNFNSARLYNITTSSTIALGTSCHATLGYSGYSESTISSVFTILGTAVIELQHKCSDSRSTDGLGFAVTSGERELYSYLEIEKLS